MAKTPAFEMVNVDMATGEEDLLATGTLKEMQEAMQQAIEEADENITHTGDLSYYPTFRIQAFQGW